MVKFKVGDKVKIIDKELLSQNKEIGNGKLIEVTSRATGWTSCVFENGYKNSYPGDGLELIDFDELKVGSKVRVSVPRDHHYWNLNGKIGEIKDIDTYKENNTRSYLVCVSEQTIFLAREEVEAIELCHFNYCGE